MITVIDLFSNGNLKIGSDTMTYNLAAATDCPSHALGLCNIRSRCYAMKAERGYYPNVLPHRRKQEQLWFQISAEAFAYDVLRVASIKKEKIRFFRFNESGDAHSQNCILKMNQIAEILRIEGNIHTYTYSARRDLDWSVSSNIVVNGANFMPGTFLSNSFIPVKTEKELKDFFFVCKNDCRICDHCKFGGNKLIGALIH